MHLLSRLFLGIGFLFVGCDFGNSQPKYYCPEAYCTVDYLHVSIPGDSKHCQIAVCGVQEAHYIPWINSQTGVTEKWYDVQRRKFVDEPGK